jgi:hypothetical protein
MIQLNQSREHFHVILSQYIHKVTDFASIQEEGDEIDVG